MLALETNEGDMSDLRKKADVYRFSDSARLQLASLVSEAVRAALEEQGLKRPRVPAGALKAVDAAQIGISRSGFHALLKDDPSLGQRFFTTDRSRLWPTAALDTWMLARQSCLMLTEPQAGPHCLRRDACEACAQAERHSPEKLSARTQRGPPRPNTQIKSPANCSGLQ
jgi:hypothetical protein